MASIRPKSAKPANIPPTGKAKPAKGAAGKAIADANKPPRDGRRPLARRRVQALVAIAVAALLAWGGRAAWRGVAPHVISGDRYLLPAEAITVSDPPAWLACDVRGQVIRSAGLDRRLSILDDGFVQAVQSAFSLHPWVESVDRVTKSYPPAVRVELTYRKPIAVIEAPLAGNVQLLPVDSHGIHLPAEDVPLIRRGYLPRITGIVGQPPAGQKWEDPRVAGGVDLAVLLADAWERLHLAEIVPSARPEVQGDHSFFVYELLTQGGTRIDWGPAPHAGVPDEDEFKTKLKRLDECAADYGPFDSVKSPGAIDIRHGKSVTQRQVKKPQEPAHDETVVK